MNRTRTNRSGGIQGGISNGETIIIRIAFKPTSTISLMQNTVTREGNNYGFYFLLNNSICFTNLILMTTL